VDFVTGFFSERIYLKKVTFSFNFFLVLAKLSAPVIKMLAGVPPPKQLL
jgi:hypothetical protein